MRNEVKSLLGKEGGDAFETLNEVHDFEAQEAKVKEVKV